MSVVSKIVSGFRALALAIEGNEGIRARMNKGRNTVTLSRFPPLLGGSVFSVIFGTIITISYMIKGNRQRSTILPSAPSVGLAASIPLHVKFPSIPSIPTLNTHKIAREYGNRPIAYSLRVLESLHKGPKAALGMVRAWMEGMGGYRSMAGLFDPKSPHCSNGGIEGRQDHNLRLDHRPIPPQSIHSLLGRPDWCRPIHSYPLAGWSMEPGFPT